jgi:hypothetical protein
MIVWTSGWSRLLAFFVLDAGVIVGAIDAEQPNLSVT